MSERGYIAGQWNAICDVCGFRFKSSKLQKRWDGLMTCSECWEQRHIIDFTKAPPPEQAPTWTRPEGADQEIEINYVNTTVGTQSTDIPEGTNNGEL